MDVAMDLIGRSLVDYHTRFENPDSISTLTGIITIILEKSVEFLINENLWQRVTAHVNF